MIAPEYCHSDKGDKRMEQLKIIVEKHPDGYVAYPLGLKGIVVGQGDTYEQALENIRDAIRLHVEDRIESGEEIPQPESVSLTSLEIEV